MYDFELPPEHFKIPRIAIIGSRTLARYSERILARGFSELGWEIVSPDSAKYILLQIHGAPQAKADDSEILDLLAKLISEERCERIGVLIHRPDECALLHTDLTSRLSQLTHHSFIALLGTHHLKDKWLRDLNCRVTAIPHGFFSAKAPPQLTDQIVIGSITSWGEMRRVGDAVKLIAEVFKRCEPGEFIGYLSGAPREELTELKITEVLNQISDLPKIELVNDYGLAPNPRHKHVLVVDHQAKEGRGLPPPSINIQLYHLNGTIRTGENSGSLHSYPSLPVILEMNGAEVLEDLKVIKVAYSDPLSIDSADLISAAQEIISLTRGGGYKKALQHNTRRAKQLTPLSIARSYAALFTKVEGGEQ
jgi:hypothetical protein